MILFNSTATVKRKMRSYDPAASPLYDIETLTIIYTDIPCRLYSVKPQEYQQAEGGKSITQSRSCLFSNSITIKQNDIIEIGSYTFYAYNVNEKQLLYTFVELKEM